MNKLLLLACFGQPGRMQAVESVAQRFLFGLKVRDQLRNVREVVVCRETRGREGEACRQETIEALAVVVQDDGGVFEFACIAGRGKVFKRIRESRPVVMPEGYELRLNGLPILRRRIEDVGQGELPRAPDRLASEFAILQEKSRELRSDRSSSFPGGVVRCA